MPCSCELESSWQGWLFLRGYNGFLYVDLHTRSRQFQHTCASRYRLQKTKFGSPSYLAWSAPPVLDDTIHIAP